MTRPLIAVTRDDEILQYLMHLDSPVLLAGDADSVPQLYDEALLDYGELPLVLAGSDEMYRVPSSPPPPRCFGVMYVDFEALDDEILGHAWTSEQSHRLIYLPCQWGYLQALLDDASLETA